MLRTKNAARCATQHPDTSRVSEIRACVFTYGKNTNPTKISIQMLCGNFIIAHSNLFCNQLFNFLALSHIIY